MRRPVMRGSPGAPAVSRNVTRRPINCSSASSFTLRLSPLDRRADEAAVFGPGSIVVLHPGIAEQVLQREPGDGGALADATVGDDVAVGRNAPGLVQRPELIGGLEGAVRLDVFSPGNVG